MKLINFGHALSDDAVQQLTKAIGPFETQQVKVQLDMTSPLGAQTKAAVDAVGLTPDQWQTQPFAVVLPGATVAAALVIAEIGGRSGSLPRVVSLVSGEDRVFRLSEVIDLNEARNEARKLR